MLETYKIKDSQPNLYNSALNKLKNWKITDEQIDEIIRSNKIEENFDIYADYSGVIQKKRVSVGDHLPQGGVIFDIQNLNRLWAVFDVYEKDLSILKIGDLISFQTPSLPEKKFMAKVTFVNPVINSQTRTASVRVEINNTDRLLKPEMFVSGVLAGNRTSEMNILIPKTTVLWTGQRLVVYVKVPEMSIPSFEFREVLLGEGVGDQYQIISGLEIGEEIVTHGAFVIDASAQLNNQSSMMNRLVPGAVKEDFLPDYTSETPTEFKSQLQVLDKAYIKIKDALVQTDAALTAKTATAFLTSLKQVDMSLISGEAHTYWMEQETEIKTSANNISQEKDIKKQREYFVKLSTAIVNSTTVFGLTNQTYFVLYCPMANDKKGASWLSEEKEIRNPYFGEKMMTCGEVKTKVDKHFKNEMPDMNSNQPILGNNH